MSDELYFDVELKKCLDAARFSDCGEGDQWDWWYQRLHRAHDASVDRVTDTQRGENAKLRELVKGIYMNYAADGVAPLGMIFEYASRMKELGIEVPE